MNWNHLYCFYEAAKHKSIKNAASKMGLAPSTVSEQIKKLESSYGVQLFERKVREIVLSPRGEEVYSYSKKVFANGLRLVDNLTIQDEGGYDVTFSIEAHLESSSMSETLSDYFKLYKDFGHTRTKRSKNFSQTMHFLENDIVDVGITDNKLNNELYDDILIAESNMHFYVSQELASEFQDLSIQQLISEFPLGFLSSDDKLIVKVQKVLRNSGLFLKETFYTEHLDYLNNLCLNGDIIMVAIDSMPIEGLVNLALPCSIKVPIYAIHKKRNENLLFVKKLKELIHCGDERIINIH